MLRLIRGMLSGGISIGSHFSGSCELSLLTMVGIFIYSASFE